ncbi:transposase [Flavobacterium noncentrifugens]|uniref:Site-specific recombinase XerD n=1 Tax=Flavobacterium noncentrifugens TaxID=1128970 RepID=A0A1G8V016_9FLAO|nr:phage integrase SAM-like domain-containing protein [Flavobacterium noncentrifugens]GEP50277.1 transposase [Flavobacterium noncentrifugens]SDJ59197.1 Site-specific recombinase XerD [Flavobacterium noncentrifugens]
MASIQFRIRSKANKHVAIKVRLSISRSGVFELNSGFNTHPDNWGKNNFPKQNSEDGKKLFSNLKKLETFIHAKLNEDQGSETVINSYWLEKCVNDCFNRVSASDSNIFSNYVQHIIDNASTRKVKRAGKIKIGLSKNTIKNYRMFKNVFTRYEVSIKRQISFMEINNPFIERFTTWLLNNENYGVSYAGKHLDMIKTVCLDADRNEIRVHPHSKVIQSFRKTDDDRYIQTLSFEELDKVREAIIETEELKNVRNWMLLGCEIAQRSGDLLELKPEDFRYKNGLLYLDVDQEKVGKDVTVPIIKPHIIKIIENDFPKQINYDRFNDLIKVVCQVAGLTQIVEGEKRNPLTNRVEFGRYPKWELISTHCLRRSFATNYYMRIPTPLLMTITGHSKESTFLVYINKRQDKDANADLFRKLVQDWEREKITKLQVIRSS